MISRQPQNMHRRVTKSLARRSSSRTWHLSLLKAILSKGIASTAKCSYYVLAVISVNPIQRQHKEPPPAHLLSPLSAFFWLRRPQLAQPRSPARLRSLMATPSRSTRCASGSLASTRQKARSSALRPRPSLGAAARPPPLPWPISSAGRRSSAPSASKIAMAERFPAAIAAILKSTPGSSRTGGPFATMTKRVSIRGCSAGQPQLVAGSGRDHSSAQAIGDDNTNDLLASNDFQEAL